MNTAHPRWWASVGSLAISAASIGSLLVGVNPVAADQSDGPRMTLLARDATGIVGTFRSSGQEIDFDNPFFQSLGNNGRSCVTCHVPDAGWSLTPSEVQHRFAVSRGTDPLFRVVDGSNSPTADVSTVAARRTAYSTLLNKGVIRIGIGIPENAEFALVAVDDPYQFASANQLSLFRRPLPSTNLGFLSAVMWDGRETLEKLLSTNTVAQNQAMLRFDLAHQSVDATLGHAQATIAPTTDQQQAIVNFELSLFTAQMIDQRAGPLQVENGRGGPHGLSKQPFYIGINDLFVQGTTPPIVVPPTEPMTLFKAWATPHHTPAQQAVARGEALFNSKPITISGVAGLNDALGLPSFQGTCATCHNTPNIGNHSTAVPLNIGIADASRRTPDMPLYTLRNTTTGEIVQTTDPGRALITGKWSDIGKFKGPILRALAARPPYFHNGSAADLDQAVDFYNTRFNIGLSAEEHVDLVAFLRSL